MSGDSSDDSPIPTKVARLSTIEQEVVEVAKTSRDPAYAFHTYTFTTVTAGFSTSSTWSDSYLQVRSFPPAAVTVARLPPIVAAIPEVPRDSTTPLYTTAASTAFPIPSITLSYFHDRSYDGANLARDAINKELESLNLRYWNARKAIRSHINYLSEYNGFVQKMKRIGRNIWVIGKCNRLPIPYFLLPPIRDCLKRLQQQIEKFEEEVAKNHPARTLDALQERFLSAKEILQTKNAKKVKKLKNDEEYIESCFEIVMGDVADLKPFTEITDDIFDFDLQPYAQIEESLVEILTEIEKFEEAVNGEDDSDSDQFDDDPLG